MIRAALLALLLAGCASAPNLSVEEQAKLATLALDLTGGGTCSGTVMKPGNVILTAQHCIDGADLLAGNLVPVNVLAVVDDGSDHVLITVDHTFPHWAEFGPEMAQCDLVFMYGNPAGLRGLYRKGYVMGRSEKAIYLDMMIGHGDSGAAIFNEKGQVVGVVTGFGQQAVFTPGVILPFASGFLP